MDTSQYISAMKEQTATLADWVDGKDPATRVPTCPEWTLADLVDHVGGVQRMVTILVEDRRPDDPSRAFTDTVPVPADSHQWKEWLTETSTAASRAYQSVTDDTPVWDPSGAGAGVPFWARRLFGELSVHRADAAAALGLDYQLAPDAAVVALDDWLDVMTSQGYWDNVPGFAEAMRGDGQTLHFHATDSEGEWLARRQADRIVLERAHADADLTLAGPATELLLVISRRLPLDAAANLDISGDRALLEHWIDHMDWVAG